MTPRGVTPRGVTPPRNTRRMASAPQRQWPPNVLRRVTPVEPPPSLAREVVSEVIAPALACAAACAALAAWLL